LDQQRTGEYSPVSSIHTIALWIGVLRHLLRCRRRMQIFTMSHHERALCIQLDYAGGEIGHRLASYIHHSGGHCGMTARICYMLGMLLYTYQPRRAYVQIHSIAAPSVALLTVSCCLIALQ